MEMANDVGDGEFLDFPTPVDILPAVDPSIRAKMSRGEVLLGDR